jgi:phosphoribosyl 1,2-cyclic phosphodiesterase
MAKITSCKIRMYTMGTGDCFLLSFFSDEDTVNPQFKLMIDCGVIRISETKMEDYAKDIVTSTNGKIDALLITHEHQDHVLGFE